MKAAVIIAVLSAAVIGEATMIVVSRQQTAAAIADRMASDDAVLTMFGLLRACQKTMSI